ncbi:MAG TPA: hypothetical protein VK886_20755 [Vicinamibacterales bacterium]|nr:hypothetical protein [Vicinamibacterales bacterium]
MADRVSQLTADVQRLSRTVQQLERRVVELEGALAVAAAAGLRPPPAGSLAASAPQGDPATTVDEGLSTLSGAMALVGRTLVVLGGAYLLRALTEAHVLPKSAGVALGLMYATVWLAAAARRAVPSASATFHATAATLIVLPMVWEASFKFQIVRPEGSAALLALFAAAGLVVAVRRRIEPIAWVVALGVSAGAVVLGVATRGFVSHTILLIAVGIAAVWIGYVCDWILLRWPTAALAGAMVAGVTLRGASGQEPLAAFGVQVLFFAAYLGSFALRTLFLGRAVIPFEVAQSIAVVAIGYGGAIYVTAATGAKVVTPGLLGLAFGAAAYAVAFAFVERRRPPRNFFFYASLALTFVLAGAVLALGSAGAAILFSALGTVAAIAARRVCRLTLAMHCTVYVLAAALLSGLAWTTAAALFGSPSGGWSVPGAPALVVLAAIALCVLIPARRCDDDGIGRGIPRYILLTLFVWTASGAIVAFMATTAGLDAAWVAATRTVVLVAAALLLASGRAGALADALWMVYPLLAIVAMKLLVEDLPRGRPSTLMVAVAAYGLALIAGPKLLRQRGPLV